jgi:hypothetical protein
MKIAAFSRPPGGRPPLLTASATLARVLTFVLLFCVMEGRAGGFAQNLTGSFKKASLQSVFSWIHKETGYVVFCDYSILTKTEPVTFSVKNATVSEVLNDALGGEGLTYAVEEKGSGSTHDCLQRSSRKSYNGESQ